jgi:hypothetical protein
VPGGVPPPRKAREREYVGCAVAAVAIAWHGPAASKNTEP